MEARLKEDILMEAARYFWLPSFYLQRLEKYWIFVILTLHDSKLYLHT